MPDEIIEPKNLFYAYATRQLTNVLIAIMLILIKSHQDIFKGCSKLDNLKKISSFQAYKLPSEQSTKFCITAELDSYTQHMSTEERRHSSGSNLLLRQTATYENLRN